MWEQQVWVIWLSIWKQVRFWLKSFDYRKMKMKLWHSWPIASSYVVSLMLKWRSLMERKQDCPWAHLNFCHDGSALELGKKPKHVSFRLRKVKTFILTCSNSEQICMFVFLFKASRFVDVSGELCQFCRGISWELWNMESQYIPLALTTRIFHC